MVPEASAAGLGRPVLTCEGCATTYLRIFQTLSNLPGFRIVPSMALKTGRTVTLAVPPQGLPVSLPPFHRCQYIRISVTRPPSISQKMAPRASTHSPVRFRRQTHLNSVENQGPAA